MASLRASLLTQLPTMSTSSCSRNGLSTAGGGLKEACSSVPKACKNLGHVLELNRKGWKSEGPTRSRGLTTSSRKKALSSSSSQRQMRPGCSRNSLFVAPDPSLVLPRQESAPTVMFQQLRHCQQQSQFPSLFVVEVIRLPLESPDVKPFLNLSAPYIPDPNLPTPSPTTNPPVLASGETPTEFPVRLPTPTEVPSPGGPPEFKPIAMGGVSSDVDGSVVPRGPPISPPNIPPNLPPGTPPSIPPPNMPPIVPPGTPPSIPPPQIPGTPGSVPPPTSPPGSPPLFPGPEIPSTPPEFPGIPSPPSIIGAETPPLA